MRTDPLFPYALPPYGYTLSAVIHADSKAGKALATDTPILTRDRGWQTMGTVEVGDWVHHPTDGNTKVIAVSDVMTERPCYRLTTKAGRIVVADSEHLWVVHRAGNNAKTLTTQEVADSLGRGETRWVLNTGEAVNRPHDEHLPIDPYVLGVWLGDGHTDGAVLTLNNNDAEHILSRITDAGVQWRTRVASTEQASGCQSIGLLECKKLLPLGNKHVPDAYMLASLAQRLALLQGLLDSDGHAVTRPNGSGVVEYSSKLSGLISQVWELSWSLGMKPSGITSKMVILNGKECGPYYRFTMSACRADQVVSLPRKIEALPETRASRGRSDAIVSVVPVPSVPVRCIQVSATDGLFYVGREFLITHNSTLAGSAPKPLLQLDAEGGTKFLPYARTFWDPLQGPPPMPDGTWEVCTVVVRTYETLDMVYRWLVTGQHGFASLSIDSLTEAQRRAKDTIKQPGQQMRTQDWGELLDMVLYLVRQMRDLTMHPTNPLSCVVLITETQLRNGKWRPFLQGRMADTLPYAVDLHGYLYVAMVPDPADATGMAVKPQRQLLISPTPEIDAGERVQGRLPMIIPDPHFTQMFYQVYNIQTQDPTTGAMTQ